MKMNALGIDSQSEQCVTRRLLACADTLHHFIAAHTPARLASTISSEDILQEVWVMAFRRAEFVVSAPPAELVAWLRTLTSRKLIDALRASRTVKRGSDRVVNQSALPGNLRWSFAALRMWDLSKQRTPSGETATVEATD